MVDQVYGVVQNWKRQSQPSAQSYWHHCQKNSSTGMASGSRGWPSDTSTQAQCLKRAGHGVKRAQGTSGPAVSSPQACPGL